MTRATCYVLRAAVLQGDILRPVPPARRGRPLGLHLDQVEITDAVSFNVYICRVIFHRGVHRTLHGARDGGNYDAVERFQKGVETVQVVALWCQAGRELCRIKGPFGNVLCSRCEIERDILFYDDVLHAVLDYSFVDQSRSLWRVK